MIIETSFEEDIFGNKLNSKNIEYYGEDALHAEVSDQVAELIRNSLFKECITFKNHRGLIIGFENNEQYHDYYYIVYNYITKEIEYELINGCKIIKQ